MSARMDLPSLRGRPESARGRQYWRSLDELAGTPEFMELLQREFPENASEWHDENSRRHFLKLMGAALALAGVGACTRDPAEPILPYARQPEDFTPGKPLYYATVAPHNGYGIGILVESHLGRPTKIEGNDLHPASLGATDAIVQASILGLYDPDRSQAVRHAGRISSWKAFLDALAPQLEAQRALQGAGLRVLTETVTSPALAAQIRALLQSYPQARWHQYQPVNRDHARAGAVAAFGEDVATHYRFERARVILSLDADFLGCGPASIRHARDFSRTRRVDGPGAAERMSRLYVVESAPTITGASADHRLALAPSGIEQFARALAVRLGVAMDGGASRVPPQAQAWIEPLAQDLEQHRGAGVVVAGDFAPDSVHALAHAINARLGNAGAAVYYTAPVEAEAADQAQSLRELGQDMRAGAVDLLLILGGNPAYQSPDFAEALAQVRHPVHAGLYADETARLCLWHVPLSHYLECWGDLRGPDGSAALQQPLIAPLYETRSALELVAVCAGRPGVPGYDLLREHWRDRLGAEFEAGWRRALHDGVIAASAPAEKAVALRSDPAYPERSQPAGEGRLELVLRPDSSAWDGCWANNGWLQETPRPLTKLTWDNALFLSPASAQHLGLATEDVVELQDGERVLRAPVCVQPGMPAGTALLHLGYGRSAAGRVGDGVGVNAYALAGAAAVGLSRTGRRHALVTTQTHHSMQGRDLVRARDLGRLHEEHEVHHVPEVSLLPAWPYAGYKWGMAVDLNQCIGCNACMLACTAENNVPVVGKDQVARGREMHWIRIDRYYAGGVDQPEVLFQPVMCQHCEEAPCEIVCPVAATSHSPEGLNEMTYNRCIGTRYCSNNCPYKVRRFNFLQYSDSKTPVLQLLHNPDVTVRSRGVMEKCSYCVQRINQARIRAKNEGREIRDGEVVTACQQVCPTQAIVFGDLNDRGSAVAQAQDSPRTYLLLQELGTRPRTTYQARVRNRNPAMPGGEEVHEG
ncbi:MAG: 4Fe-4S dicluster domain-containing protein [Planctomycetota bacterium]|nr:MAG: 4Fe-4S dicluster domain-containing protein [Planctomycetota bacterium]